MAKLFKVDVSALPTHEERYKVMDLLKNSFEIYEKPVATDLLHRTFDYFEAFWPHSSPPLLPKVPNGVIISEQ